MHPKTRKLELPPGKAKTTVGRYSRMWWKLQRESDVRYNLFCLELGLYPGIVMM
jgi:hypothetical protein